MALVASKSYRNRQRRRWSERGLRGAEARREMMRLQPADDVAVRLAPPVPRVAWRVSVQHYGSGEFVHLDLVPAEALGLGRAGQWTVVVNEGRLWRCAIGLDAFWRLCRRAMVEKIGRE